MNLKKDRVRPDDNRPLFEYIKVNNGSVPDNVVARCFQLASGTWWISFPSHSKAENTGLTQVTSAEEGEMLIISVLSRLFDREIKIEGA